jgi:hypothetical protein
MLKGEDLVFIYKYEDGDLFAVLEEMVGYEYELASISELDRISKWATYVIVREGAFKWDFKEKNYVKI